MFDVHTATMHIDMRLLQRHWPKQYAKVKHDVRTWCNDMLGDRHALPLEHRMASVDDPVYGRGADLGPHVPRPIPTGWRLRPRQLLEAPEDAAREDKLAQLLSTDGMPHIEVMEWWDVASSPPSWQPRTPDGTRYRWDKARGAYVNVDGSALPGDCDNLVFTAPVRAAAPARTSSGGSDTTASLETP